MLSESAASWRMRTLPTREIVLRSQRLQRLSSAVMQGYKAELDDQKTFKVEISGAADLVRVLKERPDLITVFARVERPFWREGVHQVPIKCDVPEEFRKDIAVKLAPGEDLFASVRVTRN